MDDLEHDADSAGEGRKHDPASARPFLERPLGIVTLIAGVVGIVTGVVTLWFTLSNANGEPQNAGGQSGEVAEFEGVVGHLAESRAILSFLDQHDGEAVYLDVGFPSITGAATDENLLVESVDTADGNQSQEIREISLMTDCGNSDANQNPNPSVHDGCSGVSLRIAQPQHRDAQTFFEHGVPRVKGYFRVDVTGGLYQGLSPIGLTPLTFDEVNAE
ncbi:hypothetical protein [Agromyces humi]|uniref:hypothetical protein n=1 Tax=Agromyces humi TaxID=1766800 RepID=UPI0013586189|nr:hypothetical protein [Agromyces humi]